MSPDKWRYHLSPEERQVLAQAEDYSKRINKVARPYAADLLKPRIVPSDSSKKFLTREIVGSKYLTMLPSDTVKMIFP